MKYFKSLVLLSVVCTLVIGVASVQAADKPKGKLRIVKVTIGQEDKQTFDFTISSKLPKVADLNVSIEIDPDNGTGSKTTEVDAGSFMLKEDPVPRGWALTKADCATKDGKPTGVGKNAITVRKGETTVCLFTNTKIPAKGTPTSNLRSDAAAVPGVTDAPARTNTAPTSFNPKSVFNFMASFFDITSLFSQK